MSNKILIIKIGILLIIREMKMRTDNYLSCWIWQRYRGSVTKGTYFTTLHSNHIS